MSTYLFSNNSFQQKFSKGVSTPLAVNSGLKKNSLVPPVVARYIQQCFQNGQPFVMSKSGNKITFEDCNSVQEATIKVASILSRISSHKKSITIAGNKYATYTNDSFLKTVHGAFADHYHQYCIINKANGSYNELNTPNYTF